MKLDSIQYFKNIIETSWTGTSNLIPDLETLAGRLGPVSDSQTLIAGLRVNWCQSTEHKVLINMYILIYTVF